MAFVSVTRLRLRSPFYLPLFLVYAIPSSIQANRAAGNMKAITRRASNNVFWTLTVWEDEAAMRAYMTSGAHRRAMPLITKWCDEASLTHWQQDSTQLPTWEEAEQNLRQHGRTTRLPYPSPAHAAGVTTP